MAKKFTTLLLIALILTLPLRAVAGVALPHGAMGTTGGAEAPAQMQGEMQGEMQAMHCHDTDHSQVDGQRHEQSGQDGHAHAGCNVCADCCIGAVSPPVPFHFAYLDKPLSTPIPLFEHAYAGFQPEGPERPPRSSAL